MKQWVSTIWSVRNSIYCFEHSHDTLIFCLFVGFSCGREVQAVREIGVVRIDGNVKCLGWKKVGGSSFRGVWRVKIEQRILKVLGEIGINWWFLCEKLKVLKKFRCLEMVKIRGELPEPLGRKEAFYCYRSHLLLSRNNICLLISKRRERMKGIKVGREMGNNSKFVNGEDEAQ